MNVSPIHFRILLDALEMDGHDVEQALRLSDLSREVLDPSGPWVDEACLDRLMCAAEQVSGQGAYAFALATSLAHTRYGSQAVLVVHAPTLRHALDDAVRFAPFLVERCEVACREGQGVAEIAVTPLGTSDAGRRFRTEWLLTLMVQLARRSGANLDDLLGVDLAHAEPPHAAAYRLTFGPRVRFGAGCSGLRFHAALLDVPVPGHDRLIYDTLRAQLDAQLAQRLQQRDPLEVLRQGVLGALPDVPDVAQAAAWLDTSERSLRRLLQARGVGYAELVQRCQRDRAERLLSEGRLSLKQVAEATGFSSASCFHRAFRRWHGTTPARWQSATRSVPVSAPATTD